MKASAVRPDHGHLLHTLKSYFDQRKEVGFSFLYGSQSKGNATELSDVDVAVYFYPAKKHPIECEEDVFYGTENEIWGDLERISGKTVELLVLNRAPATVAVSAIRGIPILISDWGLYLDFLEVITHIAEDFSELIIEAYEEASAESRD
jgi:predicted nucleotidyltransferase